MCRSHKRARAAGIVSRNPDSSIGRRPHLARRRPAVEACPDDRAPLRNETAPCRSKEPSAIPKGSRTVWQKPCKSRDSRNRRRGIRRTSGRFAPEIGPERPCPQAGRSVGRRPRPAGGDACPGRRQEGAQPMNPARHKPRSPAPAHGNGVRIDDLPSGRPQIPPRPSFRTDSMYAPLFFAPRASWRPGGPPTGRNAA